MNGLLLTTAISYTNGSPHIGHLYEMILADFLKKSFEYIYDDVKLLTGTDEHGKKIQTEASKNKMTPKNFCDINSQKFKDLCDIMNVSYDHFIRTSDEIHKSNVKDFLIESFKNDDIYLSEYSGYYNIREETFITETEAKALNYLDSVTNIPLEKITEESYFFKLSNYKDYVLELLKNELIYPEKKEIIDRLCELRDLSISRTSFSWGIEFPFLVETKNPHIVYVWFDALLNYITGKQVLHCQEYENIHLIGKDIVWFHSVIFPAILKSCKYEHKFKKLLVHGFILDRDGHKMSKSLRNVIDVDYLTSKYPIEAIRYYLIMATPSFGDDLKFSEEQLISLYNGQLVNGFGNLYQRILPELKKIQGELNEFMERNLDRTYFKKQLFLTEIKKIISNYDLVSYKEKIIEIYLSANKYLNDKKPWKLSLKDELNEKLEVYSNILFDLDSLFILLYPIIPDKINELKEYLGWTSFGYSEFKLNIKEGKIIAFRRI
jgi:methionyl-tRNA synthetase